MQAKSSALDWRQNIAETARPYLTEPGAVIVRVCSGAADEVVSPLYRVQPHHRAGYDLGKVAWGRVTRLMNEDSSGSNYYVVRSYTNGQIVVENGWRSILLTAQRPLVRYGTMNRKGKFHVPASLDMRRTLCGRESEGLPVVSLAVEHRKLVEGQLCSRCAAKEAK
jgi:hypothetical protein